MARSKEIRSKDGSTVYVEHVPVTKHKICSIFPIDLALETKVVPGCNDNTPDEYMGEVAGTRYSFIEVGPKATREFIGGGKNDTWRVSVDIPAYDNARDMIGYVFSNEADEPSPSRRSADLEGRGLFVPKGADPTAAEIKAAQKKQIEFFEAEAQRAQSWWAVHRNMQNVTELSVLAAKALGHKYEWLSGESRLEAKSDAQVMAEAISLLMASKQQEAAPVAVSAQRK